METMRDVTQIIYYIAMSIAGPLAVIAYLTTRKSDRLDKEYQTYHELDNRFFDYQKLALEHYDLDILDIQNSDPSLGFDKKRKQEMVAFGILFSLFERAYLMFASQADAFRLQQWTGWKRYLNDFLRRPSVRTAWALSKETYDTGFQKFMDERIEMIADRLPAKACEPVAASVSAAQAVLPA